MVKQFQRVLGNLSIRSGPAAATTGPVGGDAGAEHGEDLV